MRPYFAERPSESAQYTGDDSVPAVADLVRKYRPRAISEHSAALRTLRFYGSGWEMNLKLHDWVAVIGGDVAVIPPALFDGSTEPRSVEPRDDERRSDETRTVP
ncbi:hypothetical protein GCM10027058_08490 [Microbacterium neimengense]